MFSAVLFGAGTMIIKFTYQSGLAPEVVLVAQMGLAVSNQLDGCRLEKGGNAISSTNSMGCSGTSRSCCRLYDIGTVLSCT